MDLKQLQSFARIAEFGSFSRASHMLDIAQPALSRQIRLLETELGTSLFVRHGRGVRLTDRGRVLLEHATGILHQCERAVALMHSPEETVSGRIVVGLPPSLCRLLAVPLLEATRTRFPALKIAVREGLSSYLLDWLASGTLDCAVVYNAAPDAAFGLAHVGDEPRFIISSKATALPSKRVALEKLAPLPLILPARPHATRMMLDRALAKHGLKPNIVAEIDGISAILEMVRSGFGHGVLPRSALVASQLERELVATPIKGNPLSSRISIATAARRPDAMAQRAVSEVLGELVRGVLADRS
jgi:LysR family transcriptional regulator, nitrogen assimilation regulatory protein